MSDEAPPKLREQAYHSFTRHLLAHTVRPGQFISQRELVQLTGMPLGAIRELVPRLEAEGLITTIPQRGMQIATLDVGLIRDAYHFRLILEKEAIADFTRDASDAVLAEVRDRHQTILDRVAADGLSPELVADAQAIDWGFHDQLIDRLGNEIVSKAYRVNSLKTRLIARELTRIGPDVERVMGEHLAIIAAIESRDPAAAVAALEAHILTARTRALGLS